MNPFQTPLQSVLALLQPIEEDANVCAPRWTKKRRTQPRRVDEPSGRNRTAFQMVMHNAE